MLANSDLHRVLLKQFLLSPAYAEFDKDAFSVQLEFELMCGQWAMLTSPGNDSLILGWLSYFLVSDDTLELIKNNRFGFYSVVQANANELLTAGDNLLYSNAWIAPWSPPSVYLTLVRSANARESQVKRLAGFLASKKGVTTYRERRPYYIQENAA